jgi:hypothetical protein
MDEPEKLTLNDDGECAATPCLELVAFAFRVP